MAATGAALGSKAQESSRCSSASLPALPSTLEDMDLVDNEKWLTFPEAHGHPLLPGIPNDITLAHIVPKLAWRDFYILSAVSPAWCHAIRSRQVYDARVKPGSLETLVMFRYIASEARPAMALYSMRDNSCVDLPLDAIPRDDSGFTGYHTWIGLDGKIYLLARKHRLPGERCLAYVFDLAGQRGWQKCPNGWQNCGTLETVRHPYPICEYVVLDGKMYALSHCICRNCLGAKVYDPVANTWSRIKPLGSLRLLHRVVAAGDELYVYGGRVIGQIDHHPMMMTSRVGSKSDYTLDIYHTLRDEWRKVNGFRRPLGDKLFVAQGKLHAMTEDGIDVYDSDANSWTNLHSQSFDVIELIDVFINPRCVVCFGDELLAVVDWQTRDGIEGASLLRTKGFKGESKELVWRKAQIPSAFTNLSDTYGVCAGMCFLTTVGV